ncbi:hypothetical protein HYFRA_00003631 [Hymenoscyphus fraxineus]|uniref:Uncharacterized protein n=1 Tax=Hymenoscyphus fraxineus TaxID=746836 RepID=A0A9N9L087_9HELO|nr:hypothetical protein HYFRA_00003631 [Hymenoscyphus fraxineus]
MNNMRHILPILALIHLAPSFPLHLRRWELRTPPRARNRPHEFFRGVRPAFPPRFAIQRAVQDEYLKGLFADGGPDAAEDETGEDGGVEAADGVDDAVCFPDGLEDFGVRCWTEFLPEGGGEGGWGGGVGDFVLADDLGAVLQTGGDVVAEVAVDCGDDFDVCWDVGDGAEEVDGAFEGPREETGAGEEEVSY